jgi:hypothetical protein
MVDLWDFSAGVDRDTGIVGYSVEAIDGSIGKIDDATYKAGDSYVVVDTGPWILGRKVLLPAGLITSVDRENEVVHVGRSMDEIKHAPEFVEAPDATESHRDRSGFYFGGPPDII